MGKLVQGRLDFKRKQETKMKKKLKVLKQTKPIFCYFFSFLLFVCACVLVRSCSVRWRGSKNKKQNKSRQEKLCGIQLQMLHFFLIVINKHCLLAVIFCVIEGEALTVVLPSLDREEWGVDSVYTHRWKGFCKVLDSTKKPFKTTKSDVWPFGQILGVGQANSFSASPHIDNT